MKKITLKNGLATAMFILAGTVYSQDNIVLFSSLGTGSEANTLSEDISTFNISASGVITDTSLNVGLTTPSPDWGITSTGVNLTDALSKDFSMKLKVGAVINQTSGPDYGSITTLGGINRGSDGTLGVRKVDSGANILWGTDAGEGFVFGFDIRNLPSTVTLQITKIAFLTFTGVTETALIVNRQDTSKILNVSQAVNGTNPSVDVSSLNLYLTGGSQQLNMLSVFNNTSETASPLVVWGISKIEFKLVDTASLGVKDLAANFSNSFVVSQNPVSEVISIDYDSNKLQNISASLIDINGRIVQENSPNKTTTDNKISLNGSALKSGVYFVKISDGKNSTTKKIIKK